MRFVHGAIRMSPGGQLIIYSEFWSVFGWR
jgi:hypothetical protein